MKMPSVLCAFALAVFSTASLWAVSGDLDPTWGRSGKAIAQAGPGNDFSQKSAVQPDGKIVVVGSSRVGNDDDFAVVRYNADGTLDKTFGTGGIVTTPIGSDDNAQAVAIQTDGKIVVGGAAFSGGTFSFAIVRYLPNGTPDSNFGIGGKAVTPVLTGDSGIAAVALQGDGKIVAAGYAFAGANSDIALVRYNTDGSPDNGFGTGGKVTTPVGNANDQALSVAIQTDGRIVIAGSTKSPTDDDFVFVRYESNGLPDGNFGAGGKSIVAITSGDDAPSRVLIQPDGKIVAVGTARLLGRGYIALARVDASGTPDPGFGSGGTRTTPIRTTDDRGRDAILLTDGRSSWQANPRTVRAATLLCCATLPMGLSIRPSRALDSCSRISSSTATWPPASAFSQTAGSCSPGAH